MGAGAGAGVGTVVGRERKGGRAHNDSVTKIRKAVKVPALSLHQLN